MSGKKRERMLSDTFRARVRQYLAAGYSEARIVKETGKTPKHVARVVAQEKEATNGQE